MDRSNFEYEQHGRIHTEKEANEIDVILKHMLGLHKIPYVTFVSNVDNINDIVQYILNYVKNGQYISKRLLIIIVIMWFNML